MDTQDPIIKDAEIIRNSSERPAKPETILPETKKPAGNGLKVAAFVLALLAIFISTGSALLSLAVIYSVEQPSSKTFTSEFSRDKDGNSANFTEGSIADVANSVSDSVVSIVTEVQTVSNNFFNYGQTSTGHAAGTGIIVSENGYILTNKHVIDSATKIYVVLDDGTIFENVSLVATDPLNDVAFLKISDASELSAATLGDSKTINVGEQVIAIGNALGQYANTVTSGIISGTGRSLVATDSSYSNAESLTDMIQTDAAINSGNSGGPLVNAAGEVIGINTAVSDGNGIGFAIPISSVKGMLNSLLQTGEAKRAYAGIQYTNLDPSTSLENDLDSTFGAYVSSVVSNSPTEKAGLKKGDIVLAVNGVKVGDTASFGSLLGEHSAGETVTLVVLRNKEETQISLTLGEYKN